jgi:hypothetical protein
MPNHIYLIWHLIAMNRKEMPHASLMKYTAYQLLEEKRKEKPELLLDYQVQSKNRIH